MDNRTELLTCGPTKGRARKGMNWVERICAIGWDVDDNGCWNWRGELLRGRARLQRGTDGKHVSPYRITYEAVRGSIPEELVAMHMCNNPACINPDHIEPGTQSQNMSMRIDHKPRKLTREDVERIRELYATGDYAKTELARHFGVEETAIRWHLNRRQQDTSDALWVNTTSGMLHRGKCRTTEHIQRRREHQPNVVPLTAGISWTTECRACRPTEGKADHE